MGALSWTHGPSSSKNLAAALTCSQKIAADGITALAALTRSNRGFSHGATLAHFILNPQL